MTTFAVAAYRSLERRIKMDFEELTTELDGITIAPGPRSCSLVLCWDTLRVLVELDLKLEARPVVTTNLNGRYYPLESEDDWRYHGTIWTEQQVSRSILDQFYVLVRVSSSL